jgi:uncharacterized phiE125 gp8 family phage protein
MPSGCFPRTRHARAQVLLNDLGAENERQDKMLLTELTQVPAGSLPISQLKDHLRLGTAFGADTLQEGLLEAYLRAAIAAIEARIGKVLLTRRYKLTLGDWRQLDAQPLPLAPVAAVVGISIFDAAGSEMVMAPARYTLVQDTHRPRVAAAGMLFQVVPSDGRIEITFDAGFGGIWAQVPADLAQAALMLAGQYYEMRHDFGGQGAGIAAPVLALIERWRNVRVLGGGAA